MTSHNHNLPSPPLGPPPERPALPPRRNLKMVVAYNGAAYHGWQRQLQGFDTVQQRIEDAACRVLKHPVVIFGAGRTDAGVHAQGQVANLYTTNLTIPLEGFRRALNSRLPHDICIRSVTVAPDKFHASRSAVGKTYLYRIYMAPQRPVELYQLVYHYWRPLEVAPMREAAKRLVGRHDFRGLTSAAEERENTVRTIFHCEVVEEGPEIRVQVQGDGFLYNMVRNIVGTLIDVGRGRFGPEQIDRILETRDRTLAGPTAPAQGLSMVCVHYGP